MIAAIYTIANRFELIMALKEKIKTTVAEARIFMEGGSRGKW